MERLLGRWAELLFAIFRVVAGALFTCHGAQKVLGAFGAKPMTGNPMMLTAGVIELVGGLLIAAGLLATWAAFVASGEMAFAYFIVHAPQGFWPILNKGELAVLYCFAFLYVAARGAGPYSLDALLRRRR
jgi:putative oxidoreductase